MKKITIVGILILALLMTSAVLAKTGMSDPPDEGNAWGEGGVYCADGKEGTHPVAAKIAEKYDVGEEFVMEYVCDGMGFGDIMLAIHMGDGDPDGMLALRLEGKGWGQIWKDMGLIGNERGDTPPPGILKKADKPGNGPQEGKGPNN
jgi:hypothetical protein